MYYVEFLRVFRALRIFTIVLAGCLLIAFISRVSMGTHFSNFWVEGPNYSASAHRSVQVGPGGAEVTTVNDPVNGLHVVQVRTTGKLDVMVYETPRAFEKRTIGIPKYTRHRSHHRPNCAGSCKQIFGAEGIRIDEYTQPDGTHIIHYVNDHHVPMDIFLVMCGFFAAIFASAIGGSLSKENDGHLELTWTKPVSRQRFAVTMFAIDASGIAVAGLLTFVAGLVAFGMFLGAPLLIATPDTAGDLFMAVLFPLAWYALGQALTASMRRAGVIIGMMWVISITAVSLIAIPNALLQTILRIVNIVNPLAYYVSQNGHPSDVNGMSASMLGSTPTADILALGAIIILAITASLVQWRRLEA
jgi:hypothetical protein